MDLTNGKSEKLLELTGISKKFSGTYVLTDVDFEVRAGEIHALMGENGAGKSTLMKIAGGIHQPDSGTILVEAKPHTISTPGDAISAGIAMIHQELSTVPEMTVAENLALGREPTRAGIVVDRGELYSEAKRKLARIGVEVDPGTRMGSLSVGLQQMVEIARAVDQNAQILILDEPTAALSDTESERLFDVLATMKANGMGLIYISHRLEEVWRLADRVTVLRDGHLVATNDRNNLDQHEVVRQMVGRKISDLYIRKERTPGDTILEVADLQARKSKIGPINFTLRRGEVLTLVGLIGAGRTETVRLIYGVDKADAGSVKVNGVKTRIDSAYNALKAGIGMVPESRKEQAIFEVRDLSDNIAFSSLGKHSRYSVTLWSRIRKTAEYYIERLKIRARSMRQLVGTLSGGNQQKVVLSRLLASSPEILILDEPTRGVDVGAKRDIYAIINDLALEGKAVLIVSSDLPEALGISDRLLVYHEGKIIRELDARNTTEEEVMMYATGLAEESV